VTPLQKKYPTKESDVAANVEKQSGWQANVHFEVRDDVSEHGRRSGFPQAR